ncbi:DUF1674 domain-containing protein [Maricaulis sp.]|uniref:DUF1674 domain-containing protein n=1 Tax=Maricaulis sp. TaxID=1486257 RepID=UPI0026169928|nr:DUF1674 domain-containing protein [Maricaulis sp.]
MTDAPDQGGNTPAEIPAATLENAAPGKALSPAAKRALEEAAARRAAQAEAEAMPEEQGGPKGLEPTRFGDWERKGIVSDF